MVLPSLDQITVVCVRLCVSSQPEIVGWSFNISAISLYIFAQRCAKLIHFMHYEKRIDYKTAVLFIMQISVFGISQGKRRGID